MSYTDKFLKLYKEGKVDETTIIKMAVFKEKVVELIKEASAMGAGKVLTRKDLLLAAGFSAAIGIGSAAIESAADYFLDRKANTDTEKRMQDVFEQVYNTPEISGSFSREQAMEYFNTLKHFSPHIAQEPVAAKTYLLNLLTWSDLSGAPASVVTLRELADMQSKKERGRFDTGAMIRPLFEAASKTPDNLFSAISKLPLPVPEPVEV